MPSLTRVVIVLVLAAVAGTTTGLAVGTVEIVHRYEPPAAVLTPAPAR